ncbi:putative zinc protease [compost metagenome]
MKIHVCRFAALLCGALSLSAPALAQTQSPVHSFTLDNGLQVLVREDHRAPIVTSQLWVHVGSSYEGPGQSGLSHALEHMLYKGSSKTAPGDFENILGRLGAYENAFTYEDSTVYHQTLAAPFLNVALELTADIFSTARLSESEFDREIEVIKNERLGAVDGSPAQLAEERLRSIAYPSSGYRTPIIGWANDLQRMQIDELRAWYQTWYVPTNATLVVVGDVQPTEVKRLAQRYFGHLVRKDISPAKRPLELGSPGMRQIYLQIANAPANVRMSFKVPTHASHEDARSLNALQLLDKILAGGQSSRLPAQLLRSDALLLQSDSNYNPFLRGDGRFNINATLRPESQNSLQTLKQRIWLILEDIKSNPPSAEELERARNLITASWVYERDRISGQASDLGLVASTKLPLELLANKIQALAEVTPEDVSLAARNYLTQDRLSVAFTNAKVSSHE